MKNDDIKELNDFLKGLYMGIHAYEHYIKHCQDLDSKKVLQKIQQEHKFSAMRIAERIQNLNGTPVTDEGIMGSMIDFISSFTSPKTNANIIEEAIKAEQHYAVHIAGKNIKGDISEENKKLIDEVLESNNHHVQTLQQLQTKGVN
ncbi:DUF2383 domain-containing protein [Bacillus massiliigorillae]|uniref:DUF2383 domain-containing protein n=1 Tax=Bacillus massiliigorillae TaxID=1243664 RepID=UPI0003AA94CB|nr:DUF2383 domain-containing protein [Bacillus massiliigorillae]